MEGEPSPNDKLTPIYIDDELVWIPTITSYMAEKAIREFIEKEDLP